MSDHNLKLLADLIWNSAFLHKNILVPQKTVIAIKSAIKLKIYMKARVIFCNKVIGWNIAKIIASQKIWISSSILCNRIINWSVLFCKTKMKLLKLCTCKSYWRINLHLKRFIECAVFYIYIEILLPWTIKKQMTRTVAVHLVAPDLRIVHLVFLSSLNW